MITIRKAKKEDSEVLEKLYTELEEDAVLYQPEHFVFSKKGQRSKQLEQILESENQIMLVAEEDGNVIFAVSTEEDGNAYFRYDPKAEKAEKIATIEPIPMWMVPLK